MYSHARRGAGAPFGAGFCDMPVTSLAIRIAAAVRVHAARETARRQLHALSDRELADIGVARDEIDVAVRRWDGRR